MIITESDWLSSSPVFFDLKSRQSDNSFNVVLKSQESISLDLDALYDYLEFGYSVFERTPVRNISFLRHSSRLINDNNGALSVVYLNDPFDQYCDYRLSESDVIELIRSRVQSWEASLPADQEIVLPLSGGYDSRILLWCLKNTDRVRAYTYGISSNQSESFEVIRAKLLAKKFNIRWRHIELGKFNQFIPDWINLYGASTHAHGMYHYEFYSAIRSELSGTPALLSGIVGDAWAGSIPYREINSVSDLVKLGYSHGMTADKTKLRIVPNHEARQSFWETNSDRLKLHSFQTVTTIRLKIILLNYLISLPKHFSFDSWSPFLDIEVAMSMLNLPSHRRSGRLWQRDFFKKVGLDLESSVKNYSSENSLDYQSLNNICLSPLNISVLSHVFDPKYLAWINSKIVPNLFTDLYTYMTSVPKVGGALRRCGFKCDTLRAYYAYLCIKPIESVLCNQNYHCDGRNRGRA
jgi:hypothetical protein